MAHAQRITDDSDETLRQRIAQLERDNKSLAARNAMLLRALNGEGRARPIGIVRGTATLEPTLKIARLIEEYGRVASLRFWRDARGTIAGVEIAMVERNAGDDACTSRAEMAVVGDGDSDDDAREAV